MRFVYPSLSFPAERWFYYSSEYRLQPGISFWYPASPLTTRSRPKRSYWGGADHPHSPGFAYSGQDARYSEFAVRALSRWIPTASWHWLYRNVRLLPKIGDWLRIDLTRRCPYQPSTVDPRVHAFGYTDQAALQARLQRSLPHLRWESQRKSV